MLVGVAAAAGAVVAVLGEPAAGAQAATIEAGIATDGRLYDPPSPVRAVQYVDAKAGDDLNSGTTLGGAKATIQAAVDTLGTGGGRVFVADGVYMPFTVTTSGVDVESIGGRRKAIIRSASLTGNGVTYRGASASSTIVQSRLKGFTITGPGSGSGATGVGISILWSSIDLCIEDCWIVGWGSHGIRAVDSYSMSFVRCLLDSNGGDGFHGETNINNVTFDRTTAMLNAGRGYAVVGGTTLLFLNADAESNVGAGFDLRYVFAANLVGCHMERNGRDGTSPNIYLHWRVDSNEKTTAANFMGCLIQGSGVTRRGLVIDGASRTTYQGNWFAGHVIDHVQITARADRTWIGPNTFAGTGAAVTDASASTAQMSYDYAALCALTNVLRFVPGASPAIPSQGQVWWASATDQFKARDAAVIRTVFSGFQGTATLDFPTIAPGRSAELTVTVTGAVPGDSVTLGPPGTLEPGLLAVGHVSTANTVTIRLLNSNAASLDPRPAGWKVNVIRS